MIKQAIINCIEYISRAVGTNRKYGSELESYIVNNNPQNTYDIDRLTREYESIRPSVF